MNAKKLLGVIAAVLAIVLAIWFPDRDGGDGGRNSDAPAASASVGGERGADVARADDPVRSAAAATSRGASSDATSSGSAATAAGSRAGATSDSATKPAASAKAGAGSKRAGPGAATAVRRDIGFGSQRSFDEHYEKHGAEFGSITQAKYLELAQDLRDAPVGGHVLEAVRDDGVISRFDTKSGAFVAFNENKTIRTFFKPNDGVRYFERQAEKPH